MITITLPFPPSTLNPNYRHKHWSGKAEAIAAYRHECRIEALDQFDKATGGLGLRPLRIRDEHPIPATITFVLKDKRRRDMDNLYASLKPAIDSLVDVGLLPDDDIKSWSPTLRYEQGDKPAVRIELGS